MERKKCLLRESTMRINGIDTFIYEHRLVKADDLKLASLAIPNLSGGMFGFPKEVGSKILVNTVLEYNDH